MAVAPHAPPLEAVMTLAVDEFLRFESSNQLGNRRAVKACEVGGVQLEPGAGHPVHRRGQPRPGRSLPAPRAGPVS